jgi:hypothetical protein
MKVTEHDQLKARNNDEYKLVGGSDQACQTNVEELCGYDMSVAWKWVVIDCYLLQCDTPPLLCKQITEQSRKISELRYSTHSSFLTLLFLSPSSPLLPM